MDYDVNKQIALAHAIEANTGTSYNEEGRAIIVEAAKLFETYLKETNNV